jgi:hypothetical protein
LVPSTIASSPAGAGIAAPSDFQMAQKQATVSFESTSQNRAIILVFPQATGAPLNSGGASDQMGAKDVRQQNTGRPPWRRLAPPLIAGLVAGLAITAVASSQRSAGEGAELASVASSQIDDAATTMNAAGAKAAIDDARSCRIPLAEITLAAASGTTSTVRVHSGSYVSPSYVLTDQRQRIAIPFPAAYPSGRGIISIDGQAQNLAVALIPTWNINSLTGTAAMNVIWTPKTGC